MGAINFPITGYSYYLAKTYKPCADFCNANQIMDYLQFDYKVGNELSLCTFFDVGIIAHAESLINAIKKTSPFLLNIFKRPVIHLKENYVTRPVDAVQRVDRETVNNLFRHPENWKSIDRDGIVPERLLTKIYDDDYCIYENRVFRSLMDKIFLFLQSRIYNLSELLDVFHGNINIDKMDGHNHPNYYIAIGKLYQGFSKAKAPVDISEMLLKASTLYSTLAGNKGQLVYRRNKPSKSVLLNVKKTNILSMHKDYKHVYKLVQILDERNFKLLDENDEVDAMSCQANYENFCQMLILFAVTNFNVDYDPQKTVYENKKLNLKLRFWDKWDVTLSDSNASVGQIRTIEMRTTHGTDTFKYLFIPMSYYYGHDKTAQYESITKLMSETGAKYDRYIFLEPFPFDFSEYYSYNVSLLYKNKLLHYAALPVSTSDIYSFRRIQKLLLTCMLESDYSHNICAFCGDTFTVKDNRRVCNKCLLVIEHIACINCKRNFIITYNDKDKGKKQKNEKHEIMKYLPGFYLKEKKYLFKDITEISETTCICPFCAAENKRIIKETGYE